jgi:hypothetical protein
MDPAAAAAGGVAMALLLLVVATVQIEGKEGKRQQQK